MIIYFIIFLLIILFDFLKIKHKYALYFVFITVSLFLSSGYMTGSDWRGYELNYNYLNNDNIWNFDTEYGYIIYSLIAKNINLSFWPYLIITKLILFFFIFRFFIEHNNINPYFSLAMFYSFYGIFLFIDNPLRNLIGSVIFIYSIKYIIDNKFFKYLLMCLFASLFHISFIIFIPAFFIIKRKFSSKTLVISFILFNVLLYFFSSSIIQFVKSFEILNISYTGKIQSQISGYLLSDDIVDKPFSIGMLSRYLIFTIIIINRKSIETFSKYGSIIFNCSIILIFITRLNLIWPITMRFSIPFSFFYSICLAIILLKSSKQYQYYKYALLLSLALGNIFTTITSSYKYVPYTTYFEYLFMEKPDFNFRSNYNFKKSPYNKQ